MAMKLKERGGMQGFRYIGTSVLVYIQTYKYACKEYVCKWKNS